jgi:acyl-homoserine lactone acylase PvdQ
VLKEILEAREPEDPLLKEAVAVLRAWDFNTNPENTSAALAVLFLRNDSGDGLKGRTGPTAMELLKERATQLKEAFGRIDPPWSEVNRLVRGNVDLGLGGAPDVLNAVYGEWVNGRFEGRAGDCYVLMATWDADGNVHSRSIHQFGSASTRPESPHYSDQAPLFVKRETKPIWLDEAELRANLEAEYAPGEEPKKGPENMWKMEGYE